ncbi:hypothetical protein KC349_g4800 [Hortaea werneckii]|nr:hypothetical protein KC349_g4800 [Hortaea werneckii]
MAPKKRKAEIDHGSRKKKAAEEPTTRRITRGMTTDAARRAVFETAELLENIFIQLPPRKSFVIQRVCKQFRDIVASSVKLQQRLFLRSDGTEAEEWRVAAKPDTQFPNNRWLSSFRYVRYAHNIGLNEDVGVPFKPVRLGHALELDRHESEDTASRAFYSANQWAQFRRGFIFPGESSLAKTYLTHPPTQEAALHLSLCYKSDNHMRLSGIVEVSKLDGLKVADILHAIQCSKLWDVKIRRTATRERQTFKNVSLKEVTGDEDFFDKIKVDIGFAGIDLGNCIAPTEEEWAEMAG